MSSPSVVQLDEDDQVEECVPSRSRSGTRISPGSSKGKRKVSVDRGGDQARHISEASLFDGTDAHNASRFRFHVPSVGDIQVPDYYKYFRAAELSKEMPLVAPGNVFVPPYAMDERCSYYHFPGDAQGIISNTVTPVDREFFGSIGWSNLPAESMSATLKVLPYLLSCFFLCGRLLSFVNL